MLISTRGRRRRAASITRRRWSSLAWNSSIERHAGLVATGLAFDDAHALVDVVQPGDVDAEPEAVEQLRPELALLGIHRPDEDEARGMGERDALALDDVPPHRGGVEEHVDDVIVEEVDLVDVEDASIRIGEQPRLEAALAVLDRRLGVDRADDPILGAVHRKLDDPDPPALDGRGASRRSPGPAVVAPVRRGRGVAAEPASRDHLDLGKQPGERAHGRRLRGAALAANQDAADRRVDRVEDQGGLHRVLPDERGERHEGT